MRVHVCLCVRACTKNVKQNGWKTTPGNLLGLGIRHQRTKAYFYGGTKPTPNQRNGSNFLALAPRARNSCFHSGTLATSQATDATTERYINRNLSQSNWTYMSSSTAGPPQPSNWNVTLKGTKSLILKWGGRGERGAWFYMGNKFPFGTRKFANNMVAVIWQTVCCHKFCEWLSAKQSHQFVQKENSATLKSHKWHMCVRS